MVLHFKIFSGIAIAAISLASCTTPPPPPPPPPPGHAPGMHQGPQGPRHIPPGQIERQRHGHGKPIPPGQQKKW